MKKIKNPYKGLEDQGYNCFACCPSNQAGLKMEFYEDGDDVVCIWDAGDNYQGWLKTLHGGPLEPPGSLFLIVDRLQ